MQNNIQKLFCDCASWKKFTIKAQQIIDLPIRKRKLHKRWKKRHKAQRKLRKS